ncbi:hypothetical protein ES705_30564 [subsurface metagenome]
MGIYKRNAENFSGLTIVRDWKNFTRRLRYYYSNIFEIKEKILNGAVIDLPYITLQKDRRVKNVNIGLKRRANEKIEENSKSIS